MPELADELSFQEVRAQFNEFNNPRYKQPRMTCHWCRKETNSNITRLRAHLKDCVRFQETQEPRQFSPSMLPPPLPPQPTLSQREPRFVPDWGTSLYNKGRGDPEGGPPRSDRELELIAEVQAKDQRIAALELERKKLKELLADYRRREGDRSLVAPEVAHRRAAVAGPPNGTTAAFGQRSASFPDPPIFYNDKDRDTVTFEMWFRQTTSKLKYNADHYPDDGAKQAYIESRLGPKAFELVAPFLRETHEEPVTSSRELLDLLSSCFASYPDLPSDG
ncbi:uncharacterized protein B0T15DRAFT_211740 [Chaetomium strumarium]|uniref:Uncharacterized protein n=1 Tax=Chaetomium strumarium TaxID=1170767 RepID=A0AAJ0GTH4_9PEZI|nr:hypothetical protein B0T15DRAFT_211740 [Chaetomium strumarium]